MRLFQKKDTELERSNTGIADKQRQAKIDRLEEQRDDVIRRIEKLMVRISKETKVRRLRERRYPLGDSPNDRHPTK